MTLTARQQRFVQAYVLEPNATQAIITAGYKASHASVTGARMLANVRVAAAIAAAMQDVARRNDLSVDWVVAGLRDNYARAMTAVAVLDSKGEPTGVYRYDGAVANKALELLGKHIGMWPAKPTSEATNNRQVFVFPEAWANIGMRELAEIAMPGPGEEIDDDE